MTPEEAIKTIQVAVAEVEWEYALDYDIAFETAIKALETVNRQQAEIERLTFQRDKAIKDFTEFAQRAYIDNPFACQYCVHSRENGHACLWKAEHEEDKESCLGRYFEYNFQKNGR